MRGIHINNYIDNRIMLSGRKVKNQVQAVIQAQRPKTKIIPHINYQQSQPIQEIRAIKQDPSSSHKKRKKRTKTVIVNHDQLETHQKNRMKIPIEHLKRLAVSNKKCSNSSSPSKESENINLMQTQRKLQPMQDNVSGLGKRSKSAIIKRTKQVRQQEKERVGQQTKSVGKKKNKKMIKSTNNTPNISKNITRNQLKIKQNQKQQKTQKNQKYQKKDKSQSKKNKSKKNLLPKKNNSELNLSIKRKKSQGTNTAVTTARKTNHQSKSHLLSANVSKPLSARGYKKIKGTEIKEQMNRKLFQNEGIDVEDHEKYLSSFEEMKKVNNGDSVSKMLTQLQKQLNTVGSRRKMHKQLKKLLQKIEAMGEQKQSLEQDSQYYNQTCRQPFPKHALIQPSQSQPNEEKPNTSNPLSGNQNIQQQCWHDNNNGYEQIFPIHTDESNKISEEEQSKQKEQNYNIFQFITPANKNSEQNSQNVEIIQFNPDQDISQQQQEFLDNEKNQQKAPILEIIAEKNNIQEEINPLFVYQRNEGEISYRDNMFDSGRYYEENPILGRRNNEYIDINQYQSIKSHQNQREAEIAQLKRFKEESNKMMEKMKKSKSATQEEQNKDSNKKSNLLIDVGVGQEDQKSVSMEHTPKNMQAYTFERYPKPSLQALQSPKFNENSINQILKLKQKVQMNHHNKLNQLVNTMFHNNILSPKTHQMQLTLLKSQHEQQMRNLQNYHKHAEQFSKILQEIRAERQQINGIQELIRAEKWDQARDLVKIRNRPEEVSLESSPEEDHKLPRQQKNPKYLSQAYSDSQEQQAIYYQGEPSNQNNQQIYHPNQLTDSQNQADKDQISQQNLMDNNSGEFNLIKLKNIEQQSQPENTYSPEATYLQNNSIIKIDEDEHLQESTEDLPKKQRGFESNLFFIKEYCIALCEFVRDYYNNQFKRAISLPIEYDLIQLLREFRTLKDRKPAIKLNSLFEDLAYHECSKKSMNLPIDEFIFDQFNKTYEGNRYYGKQESQDATLEGIFLKSIFQALNQSVSIERPGSIFGKPLPWSHTSKHLKNLKNGSSTQILHSRQQGGSDSQDLIFGIAIARIIQWGSCLCGFIPDTVQLQNTQIDEQYINHIRETRMALLLQKMLIEQQNSMSSMQLQETQVKLYLSCQLVEQLIKEAIKQLQKLSKKSILRNIDY